MIAISQCHDAGQIVLMAVYFPGCVNSFDHTLSRWGHHTGSVIGNASKAMKQISISDDNHHSYNQQWV